MAAKKWMSLPASRGVIAPLRSTFTRVHVFGAPHGELCSLHALTQKLLSHCPVFQDQSTLERETPAE